MLMLLALASVGGEEKEDTSAGHKTGIIELNSGRREDVIHLSNDACEVFFWMRVSREEPSDSQTKCCLYCKKVTSNN